MAVDTRERAIRIIEMLPADKLDEAIEVLEDLVAPRYTLETAHLAPIDDEEETEEERRDVAASRAARARGKGVSHEELMRRVRGRRCAG